MLAQTSVSYRPGARFGPNAIRQGSRRHASNRAYSIPWNMNPFLAGADIVDCGDVPVSPYDQALALEQMETAYSTLLSRKVATDFTKSASSTRRVLSLGAEADAEPAEHGKTQGHALDGEEHPVIISLGGDHTCVDRPLQPLYA